MALPDDTLIGQTIGNIKVTEHLGRGGMGDVYAGFDERLRRQVAIKVVHAKLLDAVAKARFLREARILSQLDDPKICRIYEYIDGDESDYLVLELVAGKTLKAAMNEGGLSQALRMKAAEQVAEVLVAAHERGVIHRDLKPENVMITPEGDVKVLDFGLAASEDPSLRGDPYPPPEESPTPPPEPSDDDTTTTFHLGEDSTATQIGLVMGTAAYMSPEQARGEHTTVASDVYTFGLVLQQLFTGKPPYEEGLSLLVQLKKAAFGETLPALGIDPDLAELITRMKALAPEARPSAAEVVDWLRWVRDKPKRLRRKVLVAAAGLLVALGVTKYTYDLKHERAAAVQAQQESEEVVRFLVDLFEVSDPGEARGSTVTAREILDQGARRIRGELGDQPLVQARLMATMGTVYRKLGLYGSSEPLLSEALALRRSRLGDEHPDVAASLLELADLYDERGLYQESGDYYRRCLEIRETTLGRDDPGVGIVLYHLAWLHLYDNELEEAEPLLLRALEIQEAARGADHPEVATVLNGLGSLRYHEKRYDEAEGFYRRALGINEKNFGRDHPAVGSCLYNLALVYQDQDRFAEAEELYLRALMIDEKVLGPEHPNVALDLADLGRINIRLAHYAEAVGYYERALEIQEKALGGGHPDVGRTLAGLAEAHAEAGRPEEAKPLYERALEVLETSFDAEHPDVVAIRLGLESLGG